MKAARKEWGNMGLRKIAMGGEEREGGFSGFR
jgi:hypothetical protein